MSILLSVERFSAKFAEFEPKLCCGFRGNMMAFGKVFCSLSILTPSNLLYDEVSEVISEIRSFWRLILVVCNYFWHL